MTPRSTAKRVAVGVMLVARVTGPALPVAPTSQTYVGAHSDAPLRDRIACLSAAELRSGARLSPDSRAGAGAYGRGRAVSFGLSPFPQKIGDRHCGALTPRSFGV
jgi:hypothetical protein